MAVSQAMLDVLGRTQDFYFDSVSQIRMPAWTSGRVALVGDAAAAPSLLSGQGSALAMVGAYTLAAELARTPDHRAAFAHYELALSQLLRRKPAAAKRMGLVFAPKNRFELTVRNTVMRLMGLPKVGGMVMGKSFHDAVQLPPFASAAS